jgi:hypothetical protein
MQRGTIVLVSVLASCIALCIFIILLLSIFFLKRMTMRRKRKHLYSQIGIPSIEEPLVETYIEQSIQLEQSVTDNGYQEEMIVLDIDDECNTTTEPSIVPHAENTITDDIEFTPVSMQTGSEVTAKRLLSKKKKINDSNLTENLLEHVKQEPSNIDSEITVTVSKRRLSAKFTSLMNNFEKDQISEVITQPQDLLKLQTKRLSLRKRTDSYSAQFLDEEFIHVERTLQEWMESTIPDFKFDSTVSFYQNLSSGVTLCRLIHTISPQHIQMNKVKTIVRSPFHASANLQLFFDACEKLGIPKESHFTIQDLTQEKKIIVTGCLSQFFDKMGKELATS